MMDMVKMARMTMMTEFEHMNILIEGLEIKLESLNSVNARPTVDPSGVEAGCSAIVAAVESALSALNRLGSSGGGGGGFGGGRASGGWMSSGSTYLVGELGPELITPTRSGYVHTADETESMLGGHSGGITININGDVYDDRMSMQQKMRSAVLDVIETELAYG
jgi:hypothetical protein